MTFENFFVPDEYVWSPGFLKSCNTVIFSSTFSTDLTFENLCDTGGHAQSPNILNVAIYSSTLQYIHCV